MKSSSRKRKLRYFMKLKTGLFIGSVLIMIAILEQSCLPNKSYERNKQSNCMFFYPKNLEIENVCNDGEFDKIISLEVTVKYDSIRIIDNKPSDSYTLYKINKIISFPYKIDPIVLENRNHEMKISMKTNVRDRTFALRIYKSHWGNNKLAFTYYYNK
jgi:hypothetical protein